MALSGRLDTIAAETTDPTLWAALEPSLLRDEKLAWAGRPDPSRRLSQADWFLIPFTIFWCGFVIFWESAAIASGGGFLIVWGIPFLVVGLYLAVGRFAYKSYRVRRTIYGVTDRRVLNLVVGRSGNELGAAFITSLPSVNSRIRADGSGTVVFGGLPSRARMYVNTGLDFFTTANGMELPIVFFDIPDAQYVVDLVDRLRDEGRHS